MSQRFPPGVRSGPRVGQHWPRSGRFLVPPAVGGAAQSKTLTPATEADVAQALAFTKTIHKTLTPATETDAAQVLNPPVPAAWQAHGAVTGSSGADITPVNPAHLTGDILLCHAVAEFNGATCATPAGWTLLSGPFDRGTAWRNYWFWKRAASAAETNPLLDWSSNSGDKYGQVSSLRGAKATGDPFAAIAVSGGTTDPGSATGVTTTADNQLVISKGMASDDTVTAVAITATDPAAFTTRSVSSTALGSQSTHWAADGTRASAGATGSVSHDFTGALGARGWAALIAAVLGV